MGKVLQQRVLARAQLDGLPAAPRDFSGRVQLQVADLKRDELTAVVRLYGAPGGGWSPGKRGCPLKDPTLADVVFARQSQARIVLRPVTVISGSHPRAIFR